MDGRLAHRRRARSARAVRAPAEQEPLNLDPRSVYEVITRQMLEALAADLKAVRERVDALFFLLIASIAADLLVRLAGRG
jgi:hypothetical protein